MHQVVLLIEQMLARIVDYVKGPIVPKELNHRLPDL
jgi:hypothetical protein